MINSTLVTIVAAFSLTGLPWPDIRPAAHADDRDSLVGAWLCTKRINDGVDEQFDGPSYLVIEDTRYVVIPVSWGYPRVDAARVWRLSLNERVIPQRLDLEWLSIGGVAARGGEGPGKREGIYRIEGDKLITCIGRSRPTDFTAPAGSGREYSVYRRVEVKGPAARPNPQMNGELDRLTGTWKPTQIIEDGLPSSREALETEALVIKGKRLSWRALAEDRQPEPGSDTVRDIAVDPNKSQKEIDLISYPVIISRWVDEGIYRLDRDTLTICLGDRGRPTEFSAPRGSGRSLMILRRIGPP